MGEEVFVCDRILSLELVIWLVGAGYFGRNTKIPSQTGVAKKVPVGIVSQIS